MKKLMPVVIALLGLGAGVGAGMALKPAPEPEGTADACPPPATAGHEAPAVDHSAPAADHAAAVTDYATPAEGHALDPCAEAADPFAPAADLGPELEGELAYVPMEKPFVVPIFKEEKVVAMVVVSLAVETEAESASTIEGLKPRLRDSFLKVMFRHANSGGFDGSFTGGRKIEDLKSALRAAAREVLHEEPVGEVLITEIARQDS